MKMLVRVFTICALSLLFNVVFSRISTSSAKRRLEPGVNATSHGKKKAFGDVIIVLSSGRSGSTFVCEVLEKVLQTKNTVIY
jgi:hypothetical protein